ncbi:MAG: GntR family transcriptional regulator [Armatimonadota bacterium]|nr:GntR family transcriptional regulator [Armatimonadota bacterium]MDR7421362.1 GntR family transcriptional regulator [Armatimonadota bacterium]MDR7453312.1 GntR family transcriptional regulator [Armatimonadota bacterium]MDR7456488.1 GntR family transcriptional regulator [Armatimonadota bacterium]MDR7496245.1 GntR family transcriptional regulator [Armatimonadota bacterium]
MKVPRLGLPLREETFRTLRDAILRGTLRPGTRLVEAKLARRLGISRTPIREALHKLELEGLVRPAGRRGMAVADVNLDDVREIMDLREVLESHAAGLAAVRATPDALRVMEDSLARAGRCLAAGDASGLLRWNTQFHDAVIASSGSRRLGEIAGRLRGYVVELRLVTLRAPGLPARSHQEHVAILAAIRRRRREVAETLMRAHIRAKAESLLGVLRARHRDAAGR